MYSPPAVVSEDAPDSVFSAKRAYRYVQEICKAPHSTGSAENKRVRKFIADQCRQWGLETTIQNTTAIRRGKAWVNVANVYNVIARLKGQDSNKCLVVMAHYDSQPNTPGAGDDGAGVAAMLETARILTSTRKVLLNDIVFLFTDAEESGLSGAQGFIQDSVMTAEVGLVLNFEGRGNSGVSSMFEVNSKNGWAVEHYMNAADYPVGNSLGYEIYKTLPNDTDYTIFREAGISGLNHAFIEGFVNYHSPNDKPEYLDLGSLQQHGSNMLSLIKHFGNISLMETKGEDISFFNLIGPFMIRYPASWNLSFTILCCLLYVSFVTIGFRKRQITVKGFITGFFTFIALLVLLFFITLFLIRGIESVYPLYKHFYASNSYPSYLYFIAFTSLTVAIFSLLYRWLLTKFSLNSLLAGILLLQVIVLNVLYVYMPTAIFIILFPLTFMLVGNIILLFQSEMDKSRALVLQIMFLLPAIALLSPALLQLYVVFGLSPQVGAAVVLLCLLLGMTLPVFSSAFVNVKFLVPLLSVFCFVTALVAAHLNSGFTEKEPLQSNVQYQVRADENKAYWISGFTDTDEWNKQFFPNPRVEDRRLVNDAPLLSFSAPTAVVKRDTIESNVRKLYVHCQSTRNAISIRIDLDKKNPAGTVLVTGPAGGNGNLKAPKGSYSTVSYNGIDSLGFDVMFEIEPKKPFEFTLVDRSIGLPTLDGYRSYPAHIVPGTGWNANTIQVVKRFVF